MANSVKGKSLFADALSGRAVPYSIEAEQAVLGAILTDPSSIGRVVSKLTADCFYIDRHKIIYETMVDMYSTSLPIEGLVLLERLRERGIFDTDDDKLYLVSLSEAASKISKPEYFVNIVYEKYVLREVIRICSDLSEQAFTGTASASILDSADRFFRDLQKGESSNATKKLQQLVKEEMTRLHDMQTDTTGKYEAIKTGIYDFDTIMGGFNKSDLIILAARPGVGKTSFALNIAYEIATATKYNPKKSVAFFSLEMSNAQVARRVISSATLIDSNDLKNGTISEDQWNTIFMFSKNDIQASNFYFNDNSAITVAEIKSILRRIENPGLVVIDYLQLMGSGKNPNRVQEIAEITRAIKLMAKEFDVPVVLLSQLSRDITKREDKRPQLSDLRDSGSIEQDADIVIFLDRPEASNPDTKQPNICNVYVQKNRHGNTGKIRLFWDGRHTSFKNLEKGSVPDEE